MLDNGKEGEKDLDRNGFADRGKYVAGVREMCVKPPKKLMTWNKLHYRSM